MSKLITLLLFTTLLSLAVAARGDKPDNHVTEEEDESLDDMNLDRLRKEVKTLRRSFLKFKRSGGSAKGSKTLCESASDQMSQKINQELSGLRTQLQTSDSMKSLRSELQYGMGSVRAEVEGKVNSMRAEFESALASLKSELKSSVAEIKSELGGDMGDLRSEMQYNVNSACSGEKEITTALSDLQSGLMTARADLESRLVTTRAELEQRMTSIRSELEGGLLGMQSIFKTDVVSVRSDLQDMISNIRAEQQDRLNTARSDLQMGFTMAQSGLQNSLSSLQGDLVNTVSTTKTAIADIKAELPASIATFKAEIQSDLAKMNTEVQGHVGMIESELQQELSGIMGKVQQIATEQSQLSYNATMQQREWAEARSQLKKTVQDLKTELQKDMAALKAELVDSVTSARAGMEREAEVKRMEGLVNVSLLTDQALQLRTEVEDMVSNVQSELDVKVTELLAKVATTESKLASEAIDRDAALLSLAANITTTNNALQARLRTAQQLSRNVRGSTFVRWGRAVCPNDTSQLVYKGIVGGSSYDSDGGASNRLCLTLAPQPGNVTGARTYIYGAEYKFQGHNDLDVVCAVCRVQHATTIMVPGTHTCPPGWVPQYTGHLTAGMVGHRASSEYLCLDSNPQHRPGSKEIRNGALFYYVYAECGSLPCPPYSSMYISCVVCSR